MDYIRKVDSELISKLEKFHGALVPGLIIGAYMVELAYEMLGDAQMIDAVVESKKCIADSVQLMTSCTLGNGWLKIYDWGVFAITLYDKKSKKGVRVYLDIDKLSKDSITYKWFFREVGKDSHEEVNRELLTLKKSIFSYEYVQVEIKKKERASVSLCAKCGYPFLSDGSNECIRCREGSAYYTKVSPVSLDDRVS